GQLQRGPFRIGEYGCLAPGRDQVQSYRRLARLGRILGMYVETAAAAVDLARADIHQFPRCRRQRRVGYGSVRRDDVLLELRCEISAVRIEPHEGLLVSGGLSPA